MNDLQNNAEEPQDITVELLPIEILAKDSLDEFVKTVKECQKQYNATDERTIRAMVILTVRNIT